MRDSSYEPVAAYDLAQCKQQDVSPAFELILDADHLHAILYRVEQPGKVKALGEADRSDALSGRDLAGCWLESVHLAIPGSSAITSAALLGEEVQKHLMNCYVQGAYGRSTIALVTGDAPQIACGQLDSAFTICRQPLGDLLEDSVGMLEGAGVDEGGLRILLVGEAAHAAPVQWLVRSELSGDPLLPDNRIASLPDGISVEEAAREGCRLLEDAKKLGFELALSYVGRDGKEEKIVLAAADEIIAEGDPKFLGPVMRYASEPLTFLLDGAARNVQMPAEMGDAGLFAIAAAVRSTGPAVLIKPVANPDQTFAVPMKKADAL